MKVITIKQPYASVIAAGLKEYEFRTWKTAYRGPILIHAGKSIDSEATAKFACYGLDYPLGCIIARAELTDCVPVDEELRKTLRKKDFLIYSGTTENLQWRGYGFQLANIQKIDPIFVNGKLGLWDYPE